MASAKGAGPPAAKVTFVEEEVRKHAHVDSRAVLLRMRHYAPCTIHPCTARTTLPHHARALTLPRIYHPPSLPPPSLSRQDPRYENSSQLFASKSYRLRTLAVVPPDARASSGKKGAVGGGLAGLLGPDATLGGDGSDDGSGSGSDDDDTVLDWSRLLESDAGCDAPTVFTCARRLPADEAERLFGTRGDGGDDDGDGGGDEGGDEGDGGGDGASSSTVGEATRICVLTGGQVHIVTTVEGVQDGVDGVDGASKGRTRRTTTRAVTVRLADQPEVAAWDNDGRCLVVGDAAGRLHLITCEGAVVFSKVRTKRIYWVWACGCVCMCVMPARARWCFRRCVHIDT